MYKQLSFLDEQQEPTESKETYKNYACPCGGCVCNTCVNNVDCTTVKKGEQKEPCFNCDECFYFWGTGKVNKKYECAKYIITEQSAKDTRNSFKVIKKFTEEKE